MTERAAAPAGFGLKPLADHPHQLAGATLDALVEAILDPRPVLIRDRSTADQRVRDAVAEGFRLSAIVPGSGQGHAPDDVLAALDAMAPEDVPEADVMAEREGDLFGNRGDAGRSVDAVLRHRDGRAGALGNGAYGSVLLDDKPLLRFRRACGLATDLASGRDRQPRRCCALLGLIVARGARYDADRASFLGELLFKDALLRRASILRTGLIAPPSPAAARDWATGHPVAAFEATVLMFDPSTPAP